MGGWDSLAMTFLGKFGYIQLTISSCYGLILLLYDDWEGWWFDHSVS